MSNPSRHHPAAFTLVEVMIAATILVVGFIGLIQAVTMGSEMLDTSRRQVVAQQVMDFEIEQLRAGTWNGILNMNAGTTYSITVNGTGTGVSVTPAAPPAAPAPHVTPGGSYPATSPTKFALDGYPALLGPAKGFVLYATATDLRTNFRKVVYTVRWTSNTGRTYTRTTEAYFGQNGLHLSFQKS